MSDNENKDAFASFMKPKTTDAEKNNSGGILTKNKTKEALQEKKDEKEAEKKKELEEAKKNSIALASRYGKADMMKMQARNLIMMIPFIALAVFVFLLLLIKGGDWLSAGLNSLFKAMVGSK